MQQVDDFRAEVADLAAVLRPLAEADWDTATQFKGYTIADVLRHLHQGDQMGLASASDPARFREILAGRRARREAGLSPRDDARQEYGHLRGRALLGAWTETAARLADALAALGPDARLGWAGPDMGVKMFTTARQMEVWAHGQEVHDILGLDRGPSDRLRNIAEIGVRTFGWTFQNRGLAPPGPPPNVVLRTASGETWSWHEGSASGRVEGSALAFCQVVTQVRNVADTDLSVTGDVAERWMAIAQCFAGPPNDPPAKGTRFRMTS